MQYLQTLIDLLTEYVKVIGTPHADELWDTLMFVRSFLAEVKEQRKQLALLWHNCQGLSEHSGQAAFLTGYWQLICLQYTLCWCLNMCMYVFVVWVSLSIIVCLQISFPIFREKSPEFFCKLGKMCMLHFDIIRTGINLYRYRCMCCVTGLYNFVDIK